LAFIVGSGRSQVDVIGGRSHARKILQFCKKRCSFQKARAGEVLYVCRQRINPPRSLSVTDVAVMRNDNEGGVCNEEYRVRGTLQASGHTPSQWHRNSLI
jgi:hypothetical protein